MQKLSMKYMKEKYLSASEAARLCNYHRIYVGQLCRGGKIDCKKFGTDWMVSEESILNYKKELTSKNLSLTPSQGRGKNNTLPFGEGEGWVTEKSSSTLQDIFHAQDKPDDVWDRAILGEKEKEAFWFPEFSLKQWSLGAVSLSSILIAALIFYNAGAIKNSIADAVESVNVSAKNFVTKTSSIPLLAKERMGNVVEFTSLIRRSGEGVVEIFNNFGSSGLELAQNGKDWVSETASAVADEIKNGSALLNKIPDVVADNLIFVEKKALVALSLPKFSLPFTLEDVRLSLSDIKMRFFNNIFAARDYIVFLGLDIKKVALDFVSSPSPSGKTLGVFGDSTPSVEEDGEQKPSPLIVSKNLPLTPSQGRGKNNTLPFGEGEGGVTEKSPPFLQGEGLERSRGVDESSIISRVLSSINITQRFQELENRLTSNLSLLISNIEKRIPPNVQNPVVFLTASAPSPIRNDPPQQISGVSAGFGDFSQGISTGGNLSATGNVTLGDDAKTASIASSVWDITSAGAASGFISLSTNSLSASTFNLSGLLTTGGFIATASSTIIGDLTFQNATSTGYLSVTGSATSTFANGIKLTGGCFLLLDGTCAGTGSGSGLTGTIGQVAYFSGTDSAVGTSTIVISTSGNVGIGTAAPQTILDVLGTASSTLYLANIGSESAPAYSFAGGSNGGFFQNPSGTIGISTGGAARVTFASSGLSMGVNGTAASPSIAWSADGDTGIFRDSSDQLAFTAGGIEALRFIEVNSIVTSYFNAGNVGIGTTSPSATLSVAGNTYLDSNLITYSSSTAANLTISYQRAATTTIPQSINAFAIGTTTGPTAPILSIDGLNGRVGIGTANPLVPLQLNGNIFHINNDNAEIGLGSSRSFNRLLVDSDTNVGLVGKKNVWIGIDSDNSGTDATFGIVANDDWLGGSETPLFTVTEAGSVGIGTTSPASLLSVAGNTYLDSNLITYSSSTAANLTISYQRAATTTIPQSRNAFAIGTTTGLTAPIFSIDGLNGRVGIGTAAPSATLTVLGSGTLLSLQSGGGVAFSVSTSQMLFDADNQPFAIGENADYSLGHNSTTDNFEIVDGSTIGTNVRMVISSSGNVGIGTTSPAATLSVTGNTYLDSNLITYSSSTAANLTISYQRAATTTIPNLAINAWSIATSTSNTPVFTISSTSSPFGLIGIGTSSPSYTLSIAGNEYLTGGLGVGKATTTAGAIESSGLILSGGVFAALGTATSTFSGDINLPTGKCYQVNGTCTLMSAITSLNGLTGTTQTFASNDLISIVSPAAGTVHNFYGSTTPTFGWLHATSSTASFFTGALGIGTTSPWGLLSVNPDGISGPAFVVGSSTATNFIVTNGGNVGIGTAAPTAGLMLDIRGDMSVNNDGYYAFAEDKVNWSIHGRTTDSTTMLGSALKTTIIPGSGTTEGFAIAGAGLASSFEARNDGQIYMKGNVGIGTTSPATTLSVAGNTYLDSNLITYSSSTAANLTVSYQRAATTTIPINTVYAWSIATSTTASPLFTFNTNGPYATTSINGGFVLNNGAVNYDSSSGIISADSIQTGPMGFDTDAGIVSWIDMPSSTTTANIVNSYSAMLDSTAILTIYGTTTTSGNITYGHVGIGTTSPTIARLSVQGNIAAFGCIRSATSTYSIGPASCVDIAETYPISEDASAGDIMMVGPDGKLKKATDRAGLIGVVSSEPAILLEGPVAFFGSQINNQTLEHKTGSMAPIALAGRVPVKVSAEGGPIKPGDRITISSAPGVGMKATTSGQTVGIALEPYDSGEIGKIIVFINLGYSKLDSGLSQALDGNGGLIVDQASGKMKSSYTLDMDNNDIINARKILSASGLWSIDENGKLIVQEIETKKLTVTGQQGITIYDRVTGQPVCVYSENGVLKSEDGECWAAETGGKTSDVSAEGGSASGGEELVSDTDPPTISILGNNPSAINVGGTYSDMGVTVTDNIDQNLGYTASLDGGLELLQGDGLQIDTSKAGEHIIIYTAADSAGNTASSTRTVEVVEIYGNQ